MIIRQFKNEKGITLIELLAALSLLSIVIILSGSLLSQIMKGEGSSSSQVSINQKTNVLINELRENYLNRIDNLSSDTFNLCFSGYEDISVIKVVINKNQELNIIDNCIEGIKNQKNLPIRIVTRNNLGQELTVETVFNKMEELTMNINLNNNEDFDSKDDFESITNDKSGYSPGDTQENCNFIGYTSFTQHQIGPWNSCNNPTVVDGSAWFKNNISFHSTIHFTSGINFFADNIFNLESNSELTIENNARLEGQSTLKSNSKMTVNNLLILDKFTLQSNSQLNTQGGFRVDGPLTVQSNSKMLIGGHFFSLNNTIFQENSNINIDKNATFEDNVTLMGNSNLTIKGNADFYKSLHFQENSRITINGDLHVRGDLTPEWGAGAICVKGTATFDRDLFSNLKINEDANACYSPAGYNIYIIN
ncbi:hypothetical protein SAMN05216389_111153 [Oceanobacillus limi]|uniref:Prepilin-type N-terminal cleavage/methylation domain-containing protein n=1 Tax=Oceanobacillus limi TaxID=930131 RepID=A0A1I0EKS2_9BACI|nr:prepilin-type N-terminal cleavage/methylation domain-containing protein [Oceanobacillus limi]SET45111.1 hypothetical protein SAMN05216389_111153 [Oceanobacillus limi]